MKKIRYFIFSLILIISCTQEEHFITISLDGEAISIDGKPSSLFQIQEAINKKRSELNEAQKEKFYVVLDVSAHTSMGTVSDIKYELKQVNALRNSYFRISNQLIKPNQ